MRQSTVNHPRNLKCENCHPLSMIRQSTNLARC